MMSSYNLLTPGLFLMLAAIPLNFISKRFYNLAAVIFLLASYSVLCIGWGQWDFYWYEQFLFSDERVLFILTSIFFLILLISIIVFFSEKNQSQSIITLLFIYVGATISILFTKNLLYILLFLEIMMLATTIAIFANRDDASRAEGLNYFRFHILGGTLLLIGIVNYYFQYDTFELNSFDQAYFSYICILLGLLVNLAVPPFSSWLLGSYMLTPSWSLIVFASCTTKISALLAMKLFAGWHSLIFIGIFTASYGVIYSIFENNIRRMMLYFIIAEVGMILIFIGAGEKIMREALLCIINDLLCIPTILLSANFIIRLLKKENFSEIKSTFHNTKWMLMPISIALLGIASFPFTLGYISKKYLYETKYFLETPWLSYILSLLSGGIIFAICLKFVIFAFFSNPDGKIHIKSSHKSLNFKKYAAHIYALLALYIALFALTIYFITILGIDIVTIDNFFLKQIQSILVVGITFFLSKKYVIYAKDLYSSDPNILYLKAWRWIYKKFLVVLLQSLKLPSPINLQVLRDILCIKSKAMNKIGWSLTISITLLLITLAFTS